MTEHLLICKRVDECENGKLCTMLRHDVGENVKLLGCSYFEPKKPMTNEKYIKSLNTEQLAEWLVEVTQYCFECGLNTNNCVFCPFGKCIDKGFAMEWLKGIHNEQS